MKFAIHLLALAASNCVALAVTIPPSTSASSDLAKVNDVESDFSTLQKRTNPPELFNGAVFTANTIRFTVRNIQEQARSEFTKLDTMKSAFGTCATSASEYIHSSHGPLGESYFTKLFGNIEFFGQLQDSRFGYLWDNMPQSIMHDMALAALNSAVDLYANDGISYVQWDVIIETGQGSNLAHVLDFFKSRVYCVAGYLVYSGMFSGNFDWSQDMVAGYSGIGAIAMSL